MGAGHQITGKGQDDPAAHHFNRPDGQGDLRMSQNNKIEIDFGWMALAALLIFTYGTPDIVDGIIYKMTGEKVWLTNQ